MPGLLYRHSYAGTAVSAVDPSLQPFMDGAYGFGEIVFYDAAPPASVATEYAGNDLGCAAIPNGPWTAVSFTEVQITVAVQFYGGRMGAGTTPLGARLNTFNDTLRRDATVGGPSSGAIRLPSATAVIDDRISVVLSVSVANGLTGTGTALARPTSPLGPRIELDITGGANPVADGVVVNVSSIAQAQAAIDDPVGAKRILFPRGVGDLAGLNLVWKKREAWTELGYQGAALTPNRKYAPAEFRALGMPILIGAGNGLPVIQVQGNAIDRYYINGLGIRQAGYSGSVWPILNLAGNPDPPAALKDFNHHFVLNQAVIFVEHPQIGVEGAVCGIAAEVHGFECKYHWIEGILHSQPDTQAIRISGGPGVALIHHGFMESSGEIFATGGTNPAYQRLIHDVHSHHNHYRKRPSWLTGTLTLKSMNEFKQGINILHEYDIIDGDRISNQAGQGYLLWSCNQTSTHDRDDMLTADFEARNIWIRKCSAMCTVTTRHDSDPSNIARRTKFSNIIVTAPDYFNAGIEYGRTLGIFANRQGETVNGPDYIQDLIVDHITAMGKPNGFKEFIGATDQRGNRIIIKNSIGGTDTGEVNIVRTSAGSGQTAWDLINAQGNCELHHNAFVSSYAPGRVNAASNTHFSDIAAIKFVDPTVFFNPNASLSDLEGLKLQSSSLAKGSAENNTDPGHPDITGFIAEMSAHGVDTDPTYLPA